MFLATSYFEVNPSVCRECRKEVQIKDFTKHALRTTCAVNLATVNDHDFVTGNIISKYFQITISNISGQATECLSLMSLTESSTGMELMKLLDLSFPIVMTVIDKIIWLVIEII